MAEQGDTISTGNVDRQAIAIGTNATAIYQHLVKPLPVNRRGLVFQLITYYTAVFGGRKAELDRLDAFLNDPNPCPARRADRDG
ncbi:MAG: hypothetical protein ACUVSW_08510 [Roseiflexus sp.]